MKMRQHIWLTLLVTICLSNPAFSRGSETLSKGSAQISNGSITLGEGASELFSQAVDGSANFVVDFIEVSGDVAEVVLVSSAEASEKSIVVTISVATSAIKTLEIAAGMAIEVAKIKAEKKLKELGYLLIRQGEVLLFVAAEGSPLTLHSRKL